MASLALSYREHHNLCYSVYASVETGAGTAGKDSVWIWNLARDCESPYPSHLFSRALKL